MSMTLVKERFREVSGGVFLILGDALPLVEQAVQEVREALAPALGPPGLNSVTLRATEGDPSQGLVAARTLPMLGTHRLIFDSRAKRLTLTDSLFTTSYNHSHHSLNKTFKNSSN